MADTRNKISYFLEQVQHWLPYIIQDETQKQRLKQQLENALKEIAAREGEERTTNKATMINDLIKDLYSKEHFLGRPLSEQVQAQYLQKTNPDVFAATGYQMPSDTGQVINTAVEAAKKLMMAQMAGETPNEEDVRQVTASLGGDAAQKAISEIIKVQETAKGRPLEERRVVVEEKKVPLEARRVAVSEKEQKRLEKELGGNIDDMMPKEARDRIGKLEELSWGYEAKLGTGLDRFGDPLPEDAAKTQDANYQSVIDKIGKRIAEIKSKFAPKETKVKPSAHQKGEKKTVFINETPVTYIWNGEKWLLSNGGQ